MRANLSILNPRQPGFSAVELVLVLAIVAVLAAVASPRYLGALTNYRVDAAARRIAADLELARSTAYAASAPRAIDFKPAAHTYQLDFSDDPVRLSRSPYQSRIVSVTLTPPGDDPNTLTFDGYGQPDCDATITIRSGNVTRTIRLDASSGEVTVQ